jgi:hypothetical protein
MAGIKQPILDVLTKLRELAVINGDGQSVSPYVRIWNNQLSKDREGEVYSFPKPSIFVEVVNDAAYEVMGQGFRNSDLAFRLHLIHEFYDAQDGTFEQDLPVFDLRDKIIALMTYFTPTACGPLTAVLEAQDYDHDNLYHYVIDCVCNFTDSKGSRLDPDSPYYTESVPPTSLELSKTIEQGGGQLVQQKFNIKND